MRIQLSNQMRLQIECAANTLKINVRPAFFRGVAESLETAPQQVSLNDVLRTVQGRSGDDVVIRQIDQPSVR